MSRDEGDSGALGIVPKPWNVGELRERGVATVDLRLGRWLLSFRQSRATILGVKEREDRPPSLVALGREFLALEGRDKHDGGEEGADQGLMDRLRKGVDLDALRRELEQDELERDADVPERLSKYHFVPFGDRFILHPGQFVLGITFEWLKLPSDLAGFVTGKSSWGRRGLIIETAAGIHPGFCGCLTLELGNVGPVPIPLIPGMEICQIFFEKADGGDFVTKSQFDGQRRPKMGDIRIDEVLEKLRRWI